MSKQTIKLAKEQLTQYTAAIVGGIHVGNAQKVLHTTKFSALPPDVHSRIMEVEALLESISTDIRRSIPEEIRKLYEGF